LLSYSELRDLTQEQTRAFYVFEQSLYEANVRAFQAELTQQWQNSKVAYSYKTNYTPYICRLADELGVLAEVVSEMELWLARKLEVPGERIIFNGPDKSEFALREALLLGAYVNVDSLADLERLLGVSAQLDDRVRNVGLRCNFPMYEGDASRFGIDVDSVEFSEAIARIARSGTLRLAGLHCHMPDRSVTSFRERSERLVETAVRVFDEAPDYLNVGGGFFGAMPPALRESLGVDPPSFAEYAAAITEPVARQYGAGGDGPMLVVEPGTALVANTFDYYCPVISLKTVGGRRIATVAGSIFNTSPHAKTRLLPVSVIRSEGSVAAATPETYDIAGNTCIEADFLSLELNVDLEVGDYLAFSNVGSYSVVMKPPFIHPSVPILTRSSDGGAWSVIKIAETPEYIFENFAW